MEIINITSEFSTALVPDKGQAATIGFFDGVHRGHCSLLSQVKAEASRRALQSTVVTFDIPPRQLVNPELHPLLLTTLDEKLNLLAQQSVDRVAVLRFDKAMAQLTACDFMRSVLLQQLNVSTLVLGYDSRFGHGRSAGFLDYVNYGLTMGIDVVSSQPFLTTGGTPVSSSSIRTMLLSGNIAEANTLLGRNYCIKGQVVSGYREGRRLGFPTANLSIGDRQRLVPGRGVYAVWVTLADSNAPMPAMMNIGTRPTYHGTKQTLEVHIIGYSGDLYGQSIAVSFVERIRNEQSFASPDALASQLQRDRDVCISILKP